MTLSERLAEARRQRRLAAGKIEPDDEPVQSPAHPAVPRVPTPLADLAPVPDDDEPLFEAIEYRPIPVLRLVRDEPASTTAQPQEAAVNREVAGRCPSCRAVAKVDMVDLIGHTTHYSCESCGTLWYSTSRTHPFDQAR